MKRNNNFLFPPPKQNTLKEVTTNLETFDQEVKELHPEQDFINTLEDLVEVSL